MKLEVKFEIPQLIIEVLHGRFKKGHELVTPFTSLETLVLWPHVWESESTSRDVSPLIIGMMIDNMQFHALISCILCIFSLKYNINACYHDLK